MTFVSLLLLATTVVMADGAWNMVGRSLDHDHAGPCITDAQRAAVQSKIDAYYREHGPVDMGQRGGTPDLYPFFPQAGIWGGDIFANNYVDLDLTGGILDFNCTDYTYDGHHGIDTDIVTWTQKDLGVPIYAALPGTVIATDDGHFDEQTTLNPLNMPNYVIIDHGGGHHTWYFHMKTGSVAVNVSDVVEPGEFLGLTASSGYSTGPHLHFESRSGEPGGTHYEPFAGTCGPSMSGFVSQPPFTGNLYLREFNVTSQNLTGWAGPPVDTTRDGWYTTGMHSDVYFWFVVHNLPASSTYRVRVVRPDTSAALDSGTQNFGNGSFFRWAYFWLNLPTVDFNTTGTWRLEFTINGNVVADGPIQVANTVGEFSNRTPITGILGGVTFEPAAPTNTDAIRCTLNSTLILRDPDYDQVRYRFVWEVNTVVVRDVTIAALSDMLPPQNFGDTVECTITADDGVGATGPPQSDSVVIGGTTGATSWTGYR